MHSVTDTFCLCPYQRLYMHNTFYISHGINNKKKKAAEKENQKHYFAEVKMCEQNTVCSFSFSGFEKFLVELEK